MTTFILDAATVAAFQRTGTLEALQAAAGQSPFELVDVVYQELLVGHEVYVSPIREAVREGWLTVRPLPASSARDVSTLMTDSLLGLSVDAGEAASIVLCSEDPSRVLVTPDRGGLFSAFKHLYGVEARALSLYGFVRRLVEESRLTIDVGRRVIAYACRKPTLQPIWWTGWLGLHP